MPQFNLSLDEAVTEFVVQARNQEAEVRRREDERALLERKEKDRLEREVLARNQSLLASDRGHGAAIASKVRPLAAAGTSKYKIISAPKAGGAINSSADSNGTQPK